MNGRDLRRASEALLRLLDAVPAGETPDTFSGEKREPQGGFGQYGLPARSGGAFGGFGLPLRGRFAAGEPGSGTALLSPAGEGGASTAEAVRIAADPAEAELRSTELFAGAAEAGLPGFVRGSAAAADGEDAMERIDGFFRRDSRRYDNGFAAD